MFKGRKSKEKKLIGWLKVHFESPAYKGQRDYVFHSDRTLIDIKQRRPRNIGTAEGGEEESLYFLPGDSSPRRSSEAHLKCVSVSFRPTESVAQNIYMLCKTSHSTLVEEND
uniref:Uncharacterized protein n=1 Tax=Glossina austeni TaxID=7395 RepID=A0A1A9UKU1_GLOAU